MAFTYDTALGTDRDFVRAVIGDTDSDKFVLEDETIEAVLAEETNKYFAAARCGEMALARWRVAGAGVVEKAVGPLRLRRSDAGTAEQAFLSHLQKLRETGAELTLKLASRPAVFKVL